MTKFSELIKKALATKQGHNYVEKGENQPVNDKTKDKQRAPILGKKPPTRSAGRGR